MVTVTDNGVRFRFFRPKAQNVHVVGEFNEWQNDRTPMTQTDDGHWELDMDLPEGTFKFRYLADGQWYTDFAAFGVEPAESGMDSILRVPAKRTIRLAA